MNRFNALSDPTRRDILEILAASGQLSASDIYNKFEVSHPAISQHLKVLREAKLVEVEKRAQQRIYQINPESMEEMEVWIKKTRNLWNESFNRLDKVLKVKKRIPRTLSGGNKHGRKK